MVESAGPFNRIVALVERLRDPDIGCDWDRVQTFATIAPYTIEEAYEVADAIARNDLARSRTNLATCCFKSSYTAVSLNSLARLTWLMSRTRLRIRWNVATRICSATLFFVPIGNRSRRQNALTRPVRWTA